MLILKFLFYNWLLVVFLIFAKVFGRIAILM
jgi:hypothetical protein